MWNGEDAYSAHHVTHHPGCCQQAGALCPGQGRRRVRGHHAAARDGQGQEAAGDEADQGADYISSYHEL